VGLRGPLAKSAQQIKADDAAAVIPHHGITKIDPVVDQEWNDFWLSQVSRFTDEVDMGTLRRLFIYRHEWFTIMRAWMDMPDSERVTEGSRNADSLRLHPFADRLDKLEKLMLPLEDRFGLSPLSRARLGIEVGQQHLTWRQIQQVQSSEPSRASALPVGTARELNG